VPVLVSGGGIFASWNRDDTGHQPRVLKQVYTRWNLHPHDARPRVFVSPHLRHELGEVSTGAVSRFVSLNRFLFCRRLLSPAWQFVTPPGENLRRYPFYAIYADDSIVHPVKATNRA